MKKALPSYEGPLPPGWTEKKIVINHKDVVYFYDSHFHFTALDPRGMPLNWDMRLTNEMIKNNDLNTYTYRPFFAFHPTKKTTFIDPRGMPPNFACQIDPSGRTYYLNHHTKSTTWIDPRKNATNVQKNEWLRQYITGYNNEIWQIEKQKQVVAPPPVFVPEKKQGNDFEVQQKLNRLTPNQKKSAYSLLEAFEGASMLSIITALEKSKFNAEEAANIILEEMLSNPIENIQKEGSFKERKIERKERQKSFKNPPVKPRVNLPPPPPPPFLSQSLQPQVPPPNLNLIPSFDDIQISNKSWGNNNAFHPKSFSSAAVNNFPNPTPSNISMQPVFEQAIIVSKDDSKDEVILAINDLEEVFKNNSQILDSIVVILPRILEQLINNDDGFLTDDDFMQSFRDLSQSLENESKIRKNIFQNFGFVYTTDSNIQMIDFTKAKIALTKLKALKEVLDSQSKIKSISSPQNKSILAIGTKLSLVCGRMNFLATKISQDYNVPTICLLEPDDSSVLVDSNSINWQLVDESDSPDGEPIVAGSKIGLKNDSEKRFLSVEFNGYLSSNRSEMGTFTSWIINVFPEQVGPIDLNLVDYIWLSPIGYKSGQSFLGVSCDESVFATGDESNKHHNSTHWKIIIRDLPKAKSAGAPILIRKESLNKIKPVFHKTAQERISFLRKNFRLAAFRIIKQREDEYKDNLLHEEEIAKRNADYEDEAKLCKVCLCDPVSVVFLECGHLCCCAACADGFVDCPLCRAPIVRRIHLANPLG